MHAKRGITSTDFKVNPRHPRQSLEPSQSKQHAGVETRVFARFASGLLQDGISKKPTPRLPETLGQHRLHHFLAVHQPPGFAEGQG
jgi:hypothetical protein